MTISAIINERQEVTNYVALFSDITRKKDYENQLKYVASHDQLTGLPNRTLLSDNLNHAMSLSLNKKTGLVVLYIDLDGFKAVNDSFGHDVGDELLIIVAGRMKRILRENDTLARIGGDEFVAVLSLLKDVNEAIPLLNRLLNAITNDIHIEPNVMNVSASIGVSFFYNNHADGDLLIRQADQAMYEAKANGKNCYHIFGTEISN